MERDIMSDSLDDLFDQKKVPKEPNVEDLFPPSSTPGGFDLTKIPKFSGYSRETKDTLGAIPVGMMQGFTGGYINRVLPKNMIDAAEKHPVPASLGRIIGGLGPSAAIAKTLGLAKGLPYLGTLAEPGFASGAATGAIEGGLMDPGEKGSRTQNASTGIVLGGAFGSAGKYLQDAGEASSIAKQLNDPKLNYSSKVKEMIDSAIESMMQKEVAPNAAKINLILKDKKISLNPDTLRGFRREALSGAPRAKGGLDTLADIIERKQAESGSRDVNAKLAQKIKQYADQRATYAKSRPYNTGANATEDRAKFTADTIREKLRNLTPEYGALNEPMSRALNIRNTIRSSSEGSPIATIIPDPIKNPDKGQLIQELDTLSGSKLSNLGKIIRDVKQTQTTPIELTRPLQSTAALYKTGKRGVGSAYNQVSRVTPPGTRESVLQSILQAIGRKDNEEEQ